VTSLFTSVILNSPQVTVLSIGGKNTKKIGITLYKDGVILQHAEKNPAF
jgi:hypothetical protein